MVIVCYAGQSPHQCSGCEKRFTLNEFVARIDFYHYCKACLWNTVCEIEAKQVGLPMARIFVCSSEYDRLDI
jgi:hypothetical protein